MVFTRDTKSPMVEPPAMSDETRLMENKDHSPPSTHQHTGEERDHVGDGVVHASRLLVQVDLPEHDAVHQRPQQEVDVTDEDDVQTHLHQGQRLLQVVATRAWTWRARRYTPRHRNPRQRYVRQKPCRIDQQLGHHAVCLAAGPVPAGLSAWSRSSSVRSDSRSDTCESLAFQNKRHTHVNITSMCASPTSERIYVRAYWPICNNVLYEPERVFGLWGLAVVLGLDSGVGGAVTVPVATHCSESLLSESVEVPGELKSAEPCDSGLSPLRPFALSHSRGACPCHPLRRTSGLEGAALSPSNSYEASPPPLYPASVVVQRAFSYDMMGEEEWDLEEKVEEYMRRDSNLVKEEIKTFLNNRRISQAIVGQVTGISQSYISQWLLQQGLEMSDSKRRAFYRWYLLERNNPGLRWSESQHSVSPMARARAGDRDGTVAGASGTLPNIFPNPNTNLMPNHNPPWSRQRELLVHLLPWYTAAAAAAAAQPGATLSMRSLVKEEPDWRTGIIASDRAGIVGCPLRLRRGSRFTWRKECQSIMESFFMENQYPDEAKREEIASACNSVIQKPGWKAVIFHPDYFLI
ncbi:hypothetical protein CCH79_00008569 [Gambusia affinis]|uniref:POU-specific atypical domain-containing protein n=1 Tax=Gambusia affinis TaxID=33528 RepID=A0A315UV44_GAMAF|nr:hypothetical protein CCH79_00008569 [Gambusia affinis]